MNILFLNAGRRCELIEAFHKALRKSCHGGKLFATDIDELAPALFKVDHAEIFPHSSSQEFLDSLISFCQKHQIDLVIPTIDPDLEALAKLLPELKKSIPQTKFLLSPAKTINICRDKHKSRNKFKELGLLVPNQVTPSKKTSFPLFVKPAAGSAGIGAQLIRDDEELQNAIHHQPNLIIEEYIDGPEYTVDVLCDFDSNPLIAVARRRIKIRSGEVNQGIIDMDPEILRLAKTAAEGFSCQGPVTVQFKKNSKGQFVAIELNARMGGGLPLSIAAGADWPSYIINLVKGQQPCLCHNIKNGLIMSRYDQSEFFQKPNFPYTQPNLKLQEPNIDWSRIKGVIFDLDDTLFPERQFVFSGYHAVALKVMEDYGIEIETELQQLFNTGKRGDLFSEVLKNQGIQVDEKYILTLVECYRTHTPSIQPFVDVKPILEHLKSKNIKLGLITDGWSNVQSNKFEALDIKHYFESVIFTDSLGGKKFWKPSNIPYQLTLENFDLEAENILFIGDNPLKDFLACNQLGIPSLRIRRPLTEHFYKEPETPEYAPTFEINSLMEIKFS